MTGEPKGETQVLPVGPHHLAARSHLPAREQVVWRPWSTGASPLSRTTNPCNPKTESIVHRKFRRLYGAKARERKALRQGAICRGNSSLEGEIEAIITVIKLDFIGIIITIISIAISTAPLRSAVTSRVESCTVFRGNSPGVDYYLWLMLLGGTVELGFMFRLLSIIISSHIMFPMMSCE